MDTEGLEARGIWSPLPTSPLEAARVWLLGVPSRTWGVGAGKGNRDSQPYISRDSLPGAAPCGGGPEPPLTGSVALLCPGRGLGVCVRGCAGQGKSEEGQGFRAARLARPSWGAQGWGPGRGAEALTAGGSLKED